MKTLILAPVLACCLFAFGCESSEKDSPKKEEADKLCNTIAPTGATCSYSPNTALYITLPDSVVSTSTDRQLLMIADKFHAMAPSLIIVTKTGEGRRLTETDWLGHVSLVKQ